ncbi:hypothetical protein [Gordonia sp. (in: high G+C Gram-positive bacteria)]|uniref:hypothetical protein n=1 Tax=Gordonia sp. (in: high G+C Gram-positive bacteria) TaxID=84139 RepID=UPI003C78F3DF
MTSDSAAATAPVAETGPDTAGRRRGQTARIVGRVLLRWLVIAVLLVFAYFGTLVAVVSELRAQTLLTYLPVALALVLIAALGVSLRNDDELPIYDRQTDVIVGGVLLILAASLQAMLNVCYGQMYLAVHIDLLSLWLFLLSAAILMFGLRPTARYRWVWLLLLSIFPLPFRIVVLAFGSDRYAAGIAMVILAVGCSAVAVGRSPRHAAVGALLSAAAGTVALLLIVVLHRDMTRFGYVAIPSVAAALLTAAVMYVDQRRDAGSLRPYPHRPVNQLTAGNVRAGAVLLAVGAVAISLVHVPSVQVYRGPFFPQLSTALPLAVPAGWKQTGIEPLGFDRYFGQHARSVRQVLQQTHGDPRFDKLARPRTVVADSVTTERPITLDVYHPVIVYDTVSDRTSAARAVDLGHGITGQLQTIVDDKRVLTFNRLIWRWHNGTTTMQVILFSVDNHLPGAPFPRSARNPLRIINPMLTILLRGNAVTADQTPSFKDWQLLTECAADLIDAQLAASGEAS